MDTREAELVCHPAGNFVVQRLLDSVQDKWGNTSASKSSIRRFVITEKAPTSAFSWLKAATTAFTFKTLLRHYAKRALTPRSLNMKLGPRRNYHEGRAAIRHYAMVVLNVKAVVAAFNQEKALVGAFSVIVQPVVEPIILQH